MKLVEILKEAHANSVIEVVEGRRFDRILIDSVTTYFIDKNTSEIFGAKSSFQYNSRRLYGTLATIDQFDWSTNTPKSGTPAEEAYNLREAEIAKLYKPRGRPKKVTTP